MDMWDKLVCEKNLDIVKNIRSKQYVFEKINPADLNEYEISGWSLDKKLKKEIRVKKLKPLDEQFENRIWLLFYKMGFKMMNSDRHFVLPYDVNNKLLTQQIDIFAVDNEMVLVIECKIAEENNKKTSFKEEIDAIGGRKEGLTKVIRKKFTNRKIKFIFAAMNYNISDIDKERMKKYGILFLDEKKIGYYEELTKHLGQSARYQFLGTLCAGEKILSMEEFNRIPAIEARMGGTKYYSFSIEPEKLLKICYIAHRNEANSEYMPTYQRILKKSRLDEVRKFVNNGGFFPNSLVINIDTEKKGIQFDRAPLEYNDSNSTMGILHLPIKYRSAYIIDGQHRLYGYSESKYENTDLIPVVAFIDLKRDDQVRLFMEINENQKAVPKNLRNTLNADLLLDAEDYNKRRQALRSIIAQRLGEEKDSPLYGRVIIGENKKTEQCCITLDTIDNALKSCNFFSVFEKNAITKDGTFDTGSSDITLQRLFTLICGELSFIKENLCEEWEKGEADNGMLTINIGVYALLKILNDIIDSLVEQKKISTKADKIEDIIAMIEPYLVPLVNFYKNITFEERNELRKRYGTGGKIRYWRTLQKVISEEIKEFKPDGMYEWVRDHTMQFNEEAYKKLCDIEYNVKQDFAVSLELKYGVRWQVEGIPMNIYTKASGNATKKNYEREADQEEITLWDCITLADCRAICIYRNNWSDIFEKRYADISIKKGDKKKKTEWLVKLNQIKIQDFSIYSVSEEEYEFINRVYSWIVTKK